MAIDHVRVSDHVSALALGRGLALAVDFERASLMWVEHELAQWTYKKGWQLKVDRRYGGWLIICFEAEDTYNPGVMTNVCKKTPLHLVPWGDTRQFGCFLAREVQDIEHHESREWLKRNGEIFDDPHKSDLARVLGL